MRRKVNSRVDKKMFRRTAARSKKINIEPMSYRGGIRM